MYISRPWVKVNGQYYRDVLLSQQMLPAFVQQDSAPAHRTRNAIQLLQRATLDFIGPDLWPANSPDLNPVGYKIWGVMQQCVGLYKCRVRNVDELKQRLVEVWDDLQQSAVS